VISGEFPVDASSTFVVEKGFQADFCASRFSLNNIAFDFLRFKETMQCNAIPNPVVVLGRSKSFEAELFSLW
jgi:hypothetical protein